MKRSLAISLLLLSTFSAQPCLGREYGARKSSGQVSMAADVFRFAGTCWFLTGTFGYEDYFSDLRVRKTRDETKYLKAGNEVNNFPEQTDIVIYLESVECAQDKASSKLTDDSPEEAIDSVEFKVEWKRKEYMRPAKMNSFHIAKQPFSMTNRPFTHAHKSWKAAISVESLGVPLSDHLIVSMISKDGVRLARISGQVAH
jgi:hypothetical protein